MEAATPSRRVLEVLHGRLAAAPSAPALAELLKELAEAFAASGAGLACLHDGSAAILERARLVTTPAGKPPWEDQPQLLQQLKDSRTGWTQCQGPADSYLVAGCPRSARLIWVEAAAGRQWTAADGAALVLAAGAIDVLLPGESVPADRLLYHQRLQDAAALSGRLAHAFDNILTGILGFAELTLSMSPADSVAAQYITEVLRAAQQGVTLTQQFHQFSRSSNVAGGSASVPLVLAELEQQLRSTLEPGVSLAVDVPPELPLAAIASETLHQVLTHLLDNAREAVGSQGQITLSARRVELGREECLTLLGSPAAGPFIAIEVSDSGPGLGEARGKLFVEPFFSNKPRHRGLGLALVYRILHAHRAGFSLQPGSSGGCVARVYLPLALVTSSMPGSRTLTHQIQAIRERRA